MEEQYSYLIDNMVKKLEQFIKYQKLGELILHQSF